MTDWEQNGGGVGMLNRPVVSASLHIQRTKGKKGNEGGGGGFSLKPHIGP